MLSIVKYFLIISVSVVGLLGCSSLNSYKLKSASNTNGKISISPVNLGAATLISSVKETNKLEKTPVAVVAHGPIIKKSIIQKEAASKSAFQYTNKLTSQAKQCMQEYYVGYQYALCLYNYGDIDSTVTYLKSYNINNHSAEATELLQKVDQPLAYIVDNANRRLDKWLDRDTQLGVFLLTSPSLLKNKPTTVSLVKAEFETSQSFNQRVALARQEALAKDVAMEREYQEKLETYNQALSDYSLKIEQEMQKREQDSLNTYLNFVNQNISNVLGTPYFIDPIYDADRQQMFVKLLSNKSNFHQSVAVDVPLENAKDFKVNIAKVFPALEFDTTRKSLSIAGIGAELGGNLYHAKLLSNDKYATFLHGDVDTADVISKY